MKIQKESKHSLKRIGYISAAALLLAMGVQEKAQAYTMTTIHADLTETELQSNLNNTTSSAADVSNYDGYTGVQHETSEWNHLGRSNTSDDGVRWSVNGGAFGTETISATGAFTIEFAIDLWSAGYGLHNYDQAKAWVDWDNDKRFDNDNLYKPSETGYIANETILAGQYFKNNSDNRNDVYNSNLNDQVMPDVWTGYKVNQNSLADTMTTFITQAFTVSEDMLNSLTLSNFDGFWLRARSQCNHEEYNKMDPYTLLSQGEAEDHFIRIEDARDPVPEPASMLLFGTGLVSLVAARRRYKK